MEIVIVPMTSKHLALVAWSGSSTHLKYIAEALDRVKQNEVAYFIALDGHKAIGLGGVDFAISNNAGRLWMLVVHPDYRSQGIGTMLINALEASVSEHGINVAELLVETGNDKAQALYKRLGYEDCGPDSTSWQEEAPDGTVSTYVAKCTLMRKKLVKS